MRVQIGFMVDDHEAWVLCFLSIDIGPCICHTNLRCGAGEIRSHGFEDGWVEVAVVGWDVDEVLPIHLVRIHGIVEAFVTARYIRQR